MICCHTEEIVRRLLGQCRETEEGVADAAVDRFLEEHGNSSRVRREGGRDIGCCPICKFFLITPLS